MTPIQELSNQIQRAIKMLPKELKQHQVEALLMTIAQGYSPDLQTAAKVLFNAGQILKISLHLSKNQKPQPKTKGDNK
jgi:hypothetical protein